MVEGDVTFEKQNNHWWTDLNIEFFKVLLLQSVNSAVTREIM